MCDIHVIGMTGGEAEKAEEIPEYEIWELSKITNKH